MLVDEASDIEELRIPTATSEPSTSDPPPAKKKRNLESMFKADKDQDQERPLLSVEQHIIAELNCFEKAPLLDTEDPLYRGGSSSHTAILSYQNSAKIYLAVCATSAASECQFSTSGKIVSPLRASLKPEKVEMLVFLAKKTSNHSHSHSTTNR